MPRFRRSGSFSGRSVAPRRQIFNQAITGDVDGAVPVAASNVKTLGSVGVASGEAPVTLVRTRGRYSIGLTVFPGARANWRGVLGMIVVSADAFAIGITAVPGPLSDPENDWIVWAPTVLTVNTAALEGNAVFDTVDFDSRGMRKLKLGDVLAVVYELFTDAGGGAFDVSYLLRQQFKT